MVVRVDVDVRVGVRVEVGVGLVVGLGGDGARGGCAGVQPAASQQAGTMLPHTPLQLGLMPDLTVPPPLPPLLPPLVLYPLLLHTQERGRETGEGQPTGKDKIEAILNKQKMRGNSNT